MIDGSLYLPGRQTNSYSLQHCPPEAFGIPRQLQNHDFPDNHRKDNPLTFLITGAASSSHISTHLVESTQLGASEPSTYCIVNIAFETTQEDFQRAFLVVVNWVTTGNQRNYSCTFSRLHEYQQVETVTFTAIPRSLASLSPLTFKDLPIGEFWPAFDKLATDNDGWNMLSIAAIDGNLDLVMTLAHFKDADINSRDNNQRTPLHLACIGKCMWITRKMRVSRHYTIACRGQSADGEVVGDTGWGGGDAWDARTR